MFSRCSNTSGGDVRYSGKRVLTYSSCDWHCGLRQDCGCIELLVNNRTETPPIEKVYKRRTYANS